MTENNINIRSNVYVIKKSFKGREGDTNFFRHVHDYYALKKLLDHLHGEMNTAYYIFTYSQQQTVSPGIGYRSLIYIPREKDAEILESNRKYEEEYGYSSFNEKDLYPVQGLIQLNIEETAYESNENMVGRWERADHRKRSGSDGFTPVTFLFRKIEKEKYIKDKEVSVDSEKFDGIDRDDPYYYEYRETAKNGKSPYLSDPADAFLQLHNINNAFISSEQIDVIQAGEKENTFVNAGPGTGKTYTLIEKINYMVSYLGVDSQSIMVLCFTNAAVEEAKDRLKQFIREGGPRSLINVDIRTFHSFAWWLINQANALFDGEKGFHRIDMQSLTYDTSIMRASRIIEMFSDEIFAEWTHFIVDEIQDLTDIRARLVLTMVKACLDHDVGVTVFGDSCQAIYDYNQDDIKYPMSSSEFYVHLFKMMYGKAKFRKLGINHRQTKHLISMTEGLREAILGEELPEMRRAVNALYENMDEIEGNNLSTSISLANLNVLRNNGKICLLCRNNGQVLRLSSNLRRRGIPHVINAYDNQMNFSAWIGAVFNNYNKETISYDYFCDICAELQLNVDVDSAWKKMQDICGSEDHRLIVKDFLDGIIQSRNDDPVLRHIEKGNIIVSNIHRAKGREYQTVVVNKRFINRLKSQEDDLGEFKTLYVAVTRPKENLYKAGLIVANLKIFDFFATGRKRWINRDARYMSTSIHFIEIRANTDADTDSFNSPRNQNYIVREVNPGDEIRLKREKFNGDIGYSIVHAGKTQERIIGRCTSAFIEDFAIFSGTQEYAEYPAVIDELYVTDVFTHIDYSDSTKVWCWVDFCGLGHTRYDVY